ncbi:MAG TPA: hypothetical protein VIS07_11860 [Candidatus Binatia bacterium]
MDLHGKLSAAQVLLGLTLLTFVPLVLTTLLAPLRVRAERKSRRR